MDSLYWSGPFDFDGIERHSWTCMDRGLANELVSARQVGSVSRSGFGTPARDSWEAHIDFPNGYFRRGPFASEENAKHAVEEAITWLRAGHKAMTPAPAPRAS